METQHITPELVAIIAAGLERPRQITSQVIEHVSGTYGTPRDEVGLFLENQLSDLEEYEIDLALAPLFTPTLDDQAVVADLLGQAAVLPAEWSQLTDLVLNRPTLAMLLGEDDRSHRVQLKEVTIERYTHRLRLGGDITDDLFKLIMTVVSPADRPLLKAIARRAVWQDEARRNVLINYLSQTTSNDNYRRHDVEQLLKLFEVYQPADRADLLARVPHWQQVLRQEINETSGAKPFFNERVEDMHGGVRDQRRQDTAIISEKEAEFEFLERLQRALAGQC